MFLRNFDNYMAANLLGEMDSNTSRPYRSINSTARAAVSVINSTAFGDGAANCRKTNGAVGPFYPAYNVRAYYPISLSRYGICLGTGSEAVAYDDYKLSGDVVDNTPLVYVSQSDAWDADNNRFVRTTKFTYNNSGDTDITVSEWGLYFYNNDDASTNGVAFSNSNAYMCLMYREVLDEPVTIAAGTTGTLTFTLGMPMANHP